MSKEILEKSRANYKGFNEPKMEVVYGKYNISSNLLFSNTLLYIDPLILFLMAYWRISSEF